jgi:hypothetical protein
MGAITCSVIYRSRNHGEGLRYLIAEVDSATAGDTWTVSELTAIKDTICLRLDTGEEVDCTEATNVVTVGAGPSTTPLMICVAGW